MNELSMRFLRDYQRRLYEECRTANWDPDLKNTFAEEVAHLHEELSEAFRAWRRYGDFKSELTLTASRKVFRLNWPTC